MLLARVVALSFPVCVYTRSRTGAHVSLTRDNGEDTLDTREGGGGVRIEGSYIRTRTCARNDRHSFYRYIHLYFSLPRSPLPNLYQSSSSVPVIVSVQLVVIKYDLIKRTIVENTCIYIYICRVGE